MRYDDITWTTEDWADQDEIVDNLSNYLSDVTGVDVTLDPNDEMNITVETEFKLVNFRITHPDESDRFLVLLDDSDIETIRDLYDAVVEDDSPDVAITIQHL